MPTNSQRWVMFGRKPVGPWYLPTGIVVANVVGAYSAVGAKGFADSYINRASPGTHDLTTGILPQFSTSYGWYFRHPTVIANSHLITDIIHNTVAPTWSMSVCYKEIVYDGALAGMNSSATYNTFFIWGKATTNVRYWSGYYNEVAVTPAQTAGVLGIAGRQGYRNGVADGALAGSDGSANSNERLLIGAAGTGASSYNLPIGAKISSVVFYNVTLSAPQMLELATRQAALASATYPYYGKAFVAIGDSKTGGDWWTALSRYIEATDLVECGYPSGTMLGRATGGTTVALTKNAIDAALATQPSSISPVGCMWNIGVNDMASLPLEAAWKANAQYILDALHTKWPLMPVYMCKVWRGDGSNYIDEIAAINTWTTDLITSNPTFCYAGHDETVWAKGADNGATMLAADDLHYSAAGNIECLAQWKTIFGY